MLQRQWAEDWGFVQGAVVAFFVGRQIRSGAFLRIRNFLTADLGGYLGLFLNNFIYFQGF
jgi:hypothetical protein